MKILLTAFEAFNERKTNISKLALTDLKYEDSNININKLYLPVALFSSFHNVKCFIEKESPDMIILCGEAANRKKISLEIKANNYIHTKINDNDEVDLNINYLIKDGPKFIYSVFPSIETLSELLTNLIETEISTDAGNYICNALYYQVMYYYPQIPCIFVHFPLPNLNFSLQKMIKALEIIIKSL